MKEKKETPEKLYVPGTVVLVFIFFAWFVLSYFGNWLTLSKLWPVH